MRLRQHIHAFKGVRHARGQRIGNPRYSRLEVRATGLAFISGLFIRECIYEMEYLKAAFGAQEKEMS